MNSWIQIPKHGSEDLAVVCEETRYKTLVDTNCFQLAFEVRPELACEITQSRVLLPVHGFSQSFEDRTCIASRFVKISFLWLSLWQISLF